MREFQRAAERKRRKQLEKGARAEARARKYPVSRMRRDSARVYLRPLAPDGTPGELTPFPVTEVAFVPKSFRDRINYALWGIWRWLGLLVTKTFG